MIDESGEINTYNRGKLDYLDELDFIP